MSILGLKDAPVACKTINKIIKTMDMETYRNCIFFNCPSCGTNGPDSCAFPRSLAKKKERQSISKMIAVLPYTENKQDDLLSTYSLMTLLSVSQVTWNHVHGLTKVGSQL
jgi:hypothetical protein